MNQVKIGDRIRLIHTDDPYTKKKGGELGTVAYIFQQPASVGGDQVVDVKFDDGSRLGLLVGKDAFEVLKSEEVRE